MRRWLFLFIVLLAGGCAEPAAPLAQPTDAGWPSLPQTVALDEHAPPLPASGPLGRGALLVAATGSVVQLVLEDGRQFRLPDPPRGEGRLGAISATLSPDGWWLGYRSMRTAGDPRYVVRSLANGRVINGEGRPVRWSVDSRRLLLWDGRGGLGDQLTMLDLSTGDARAAGTPRPVEGILPNGELLTAMNIDGPSSPRMNGLSLRTADGPPVQVRFAARDDDACWCPTGRAVLSPDASRVWVELRFREGLAPGTIDVKVPARESAERALVELDRVSGAELGRMSLTFPGGEAYLVADRGPDLLFFVIAPEQAPALVAMESTSRTQRVVTTGPNDAALIVPGMWTGQPDG